MRTFTVAATAAILAGGAALAESPKTPKEMAMLTFANADADKNAALSPEEFEAAQMGRFGIPFEGMDLDKSGAVSEAEYLKLFEMHHGPKKQEA